jgi:ribosomal-protein-alanine N-acetyltransferase
MSEGHVLRPLGALDLDLAAHLHRAAFAPRGEAAWSRQDLAGLLASPGVAGLVAETAGVAVGFVLWRRVADEAELLTLATSPAHRRRGVARQLLAMVMQSARAAGAAVMFLEVGVDNPAALSLYRGAGFSRVGLRAGYYRRAGGPAADAVVMRVALD